MSTIDDYIQYFQKHPSSLDICYFLTLNTNKWITASLVSKELNLSIQTVTNSLKELESQGILYSSKEGRERKYFAKDPYSFSEAFNRAVHFTQNKKMKGRYFRFQILLDELGHELRRLSLKDGQGLQVLQNARLSDQLLDLACQFQIVKHSTLINSVIISQIDGEEAILSLLGTILMISGELTEGTLTIVLLIDPNRITYERYSDLIPKRVESIFGALTDDSPSLQNKEINKPLDKKVSIIEKFVSETSLLMPSYAKRLANEMWNLRFGKA